MGLVGPAVDLTYDYFHVGTDRAALSDLLASDDVKNALGKDTLVTSVRARCAKQMAQRFWQGRRNTPI